MKSTMSGCGNSPSRPTHWRICCLSLNGNHVRNRREAGGLGTHRRLYSVLSAQVDEVMSDRFFWKRDWDWGIGERIRLKNERSRLRLTSREEVSRVLSIIASTVVFSYKLMYVSHGVKGKDGV